MYVYMYVRYDMYPGLAVCKGLSKRPGQNLSLQRTFPHASTTEKKKEEKRKQEKRKEEKRKEKKRKEKKKTQRSDQKSKFPPPDGHVSSGVSLLSRRLKINNNNNGNSKNETTTLIQILCILA